MHLSVSTLVSALLLSSLASGMQSYDPSQNCLNPRHAYLIEQMFDNSDFTVFADVKEVRDRVDQLNKTEVPLKAYEDLKADLIKTRTLCEVGLSPASAWVTATKPVEVHHRYAYILSMELDHLQVDLSGFDMVAEVRGRVDELNGQLCADSKKAAILREALAADIIKVRSFMQTNGITDVAVAWNICM